MVANFRNQIIWIIIAKRAVAENLQSKGATSYDIPLWNKIEGKEEGSEEAITGVMFTGVGSQF